MKSPGELAEVLEKGICSRCGGEIQRKLLQRCPWCFKDFCYPCRFARGVADYCSRVCAEAMFHGGDEEEEGEDE
jgi:hypothetical protein